MIQNRRLGITSIGIGGVLTSFSPLQGEIEKRLHVDVPEPIYAVTLALGIALTAGGVAAIMANAVWSHALRRALRPWSERIHGIITELEGELKCELARTEDLPVIYDFVRQAFGSRVSPLETMRGWHEKNSEVIWALKQVKVNGRTETIHLVGCYCILPLTRSAAKLVRAGTLSGADLDRKHIAAGSTRATAVYIGGIVADGRTAQGFMLGHLMRELASWIDQRVPIYSRPVTKRGLALLKKHHFVAVSPADEGKLGVVYKLDYPSFAREEKAPRAGRRHRRHGATRNPTLEQEPTHA